MSGREGSDPAADAPADPPIGTASDLPVGAPADPVPAGEAAVAADPPVVSTFTPLRTPAYRRMWGAMVVSHLGTFLQLTAGPWLMLELTGSPLWVSLVTTALLLPRLLLTLPAGVLTDVVDRRTLLLVGQLIAAGAVAAMAVTVATGRITPELLLGLTLLLGTGGAIGMPAFQTLVPDLVPRAQLAQAVTLNSGAFNVARALGPAIGGALVAAGLLTAAFAANAVSYLVVVAVLLTFSRRTEERRTASPFLRSAALGVRYARFTRPIRRLLVVTSVFSLTAASVQALLPSVVADDLGAGATGFGLLYGLFGAGALAGVLARERARLWAGARMLPGAVGLFAVGSLVFGLAPGVVVAGAGLTLAGTAWVWTMTTLNASVQLLAPRWVRGRVVSLYVLAVGLQPVGAVLAGALAEVVGPGRSVAVTAVGTAVLALAMTRSDLPVLGELEEPAAAPDDWPVPRHASTVSGTPIVVATTWEVDPDDLPGFLTVMTELRRQRLRTGATRWSLFRDADRPEVVTELFTVPDWDEHLAQHARIDAEAAAVLRQARGFDRVGGPRTRHLAGLSVTDGGEAALEALAADGQATAGLGADDLARHAELHRTDGSVPLEERGPADHRPAG